MKKYLIIIAFMLPVLFSCRNNMKKVIEGIIFDKVDQWPEYPGGMYKFNNFLSQNIVYPPAAKQKKIHGHVFMTFRVEKDGQLDNFRILRGLSPEIDAEALRVIKLSPKWKPATSNKEVVRCDYTVPITFKLANQ